MPNPELFLKTLEYVTEAPFFWPSMGITTAIAMFIGAMIYDGRMDRVKRGIFTIATYALMLLWVTLSRVFNMISERPNKVSEMTFAGTATILLVSIAWMLGIFLGVYIINRKYRGEHGK